MSQVNLILRLPPELHAKVKAHAETEGLSINFSIVKALANLHDVSVDKKPTRAPKATSEDKARVLALLLPPESMSVQDVAEKENIPQMTLYGWRREARAAGTHPK